MAAVNPQPSSPISPGGQGASPQSQPVPPGGPSGASSPLTNVAQSVSSPGVVVSVPKPLVSTSASTSTPSPVAQTAVQSVVQAKKLNPVQRATALLQSFSSAPLPNGNLKAHKDYPKFVQLFADCSTSERGTVLQEIQNQVAQNPKYQDMAQLMKTLFTDAATIHDLVKGQSMQMVVKAQFLATANPLIIADLIEAFSKAKNEYLPAWFTNAQPFLQTTEKAYGLLKSNNISEVLQLQLDGQIDAIDLAGRLIGEAAQPLLERVERFSELHKAVKICLEGNLMLHAQAYYKIALQEDPEYAKALLSVIEKHYKTTQPSKYAELQLFLKASDTQWIDKALDEGIKSYLIRETLGEQSKLVQRFDQIKQGTSDSSAFETAAATALSEEDLWRLAIFIEERSEPVDAIAQKYFQAQEYGIARDVQINWATKEMYVISDPLHSTLKASGTYKKAINAAIIPLAQQAKDRAIAGVQLTPAKAAIDFSELEREKPFYKALESVPGVARLRSITNLTRRPPGGTIGPSMPSISLVFNRADQGTLDTVLGKNPSLPVKLGFAKQLLHTFALMQQKGVFHGDAKFLNVLVDAQNELHMTDFGLSFFMKPTGPNTTPTWTVAQDNAYGAWWYTPLDLVKLDPADPRPVERTAEDYRKIESWVTGCMLYEIAFGRPGWVDALELEGYPPQKQVVVQKADPQTGTPEIVANKLSNMRIVRMEEEHAAVVQRDLTRIAAQDESARTGEDHFQFVVCNLLHMDPTKRWSLQEADAYFQKHNIQMPVAIKPP